MRSIVALSTALQIAQDATFIVVGLTSWWKFFFRLWLENYFKLDETFLRFQSDFYLKIANFINCNIGFIYRF